MLKGYEKPEDIIGENGLLKRLTKALLERAFSAELRAAERQRKRGELLAAAERKLKEIEAATKRKRQPLRSAEKISYLVGKALASSKVEKYFRWEITSQGLRWQQDPERIQRDAALDGMYVLRTSVAEQFLNTQQTILAYKRLAAVERAFRSLKSVDLNVRPIYHRVPERVRCRMAHAASSGAGAVRRRATWRPPAASGRAGCALPRSARQGAQPAHGRQLASAELSGLAQGPGNHSQKPHRTATSVPTCF